MRGAVKWSIVGLLGLAFVAALVAAFRGEPVHVNLGEVRYGDMQRTVDEEGKTRIRERYVVSSPLMGRLRRITLDPGDRVSGGQTVLTSIEPTDPALLDSRATASAEARVRAAEAAVHKAEANLERARLASEFATKELNRITEASKVGAATDQEMDRATTDERTASEDLRAARFAGEIAQYELELAKSAMLYTQGNTNDDDRIAMTLHSPIDGLVLRVFQESVAVVTPGTPLLEVGDPADLELVIDVLSTDAVQVHPGDRVIVEHWGGEQPLEASVRLVEPSAFTKISALGVEEQRVNVIADLISPPDQRKTLGDGFRVEARIVVWEGSDVLIVPTSAVFRTGEEWSVFVVEGSRARLRTISPGVQTSRLTQVLGGLESGEQIVLHPSDQLGEGVRVRAED